MTPRIIDYNRVRMACALARENNMFVVVVQVPRVDDSLNRVLEPAWIVYRNGADGGKDIRLGRRTDGGALLDFVRKCAGLAKIPTGN